MVKQWNRKRYDGIQVLGLRIAVEVEPGGQFGILSCCRDRLGFEVERRSDRG
jgi:hypothetical protein